MSERVSVLADRFLDNTPIESVAKPRHQPLCHRRKFSFKGSLTARSHRPTPRPGMISRLRGAQASNAAQPDAQAAPPPCS
jgi:hypothetical protein